MLTFYRRLYPFKSIFHWLNHDSTPTRRFTHREFAFTLPGDVYLRHNSFNSADDLKKQVCQLNPTRFEIGPVYSARPRDKKTVRPSAFFPIQRELVFDIDMTDYDQIRMCCSGAGICKRCWGFIAAAVRVLDHGLRDQFGYERLLWVYSGRRGIHLWISDPEAMELTDEQRRVLVDWMGVVFGSEASGKRLNVRSGASKMLPPSLRAAVSSLSPIFVSLILMDQDCFRSEKGYEALLQMIPDTNTVDALKKKWAVNPEKSSEDKWQDFKQLVKKSNHRQMLSNAMEDVVLQYTYPRLDVEVTKHRNHLLKAPFCVHPKTGRVCVPVDSEKIDDFDPEKVPSVGQLIAELDALGRSEVDVGGEPQADWEKTSLKPYVDMMDQLALRLMNETRKEKRDISL
ncbi:hypothetical protein AMATHDRAFT_140971 [Amanita thiersii Skay4041]|uniref:DNA primase n=1 Tax=Amanita thiersii Skay4041 TaxID=703135 RepID=A0A2A9NUR1_9AGAR|nr:hypothetical protein AMATHDRAFT_140971 [Amanita thiersii Skay4041]